MIVRKKYIYDLITRISHAGIGGTSLLLFITAQLARLFYESGPLRHFLWMIHIYLGYLLVFFLILRIVWFFKGPKYSRLSNLIKMKEWIEILKNKNLKNIKWGWGHHPTASVAYLGTYIVIGSLIVTGLFLARIQFDMGPVPPKYYDQVLLLTEFLKSHELASYLIIIFTIVHILALFLHQIKDEVPIFKSMKTGFQYKRFKKGELDDENN